MFGTSRMLVSNYIYIGIYIYYVRDFPFENPSCGNLQTKYLEIEILSLTKFGKLWFRSLERHKPFTSRIHANGYCLSRDVNHLQVFLPLNSLFLSIFMRDPNHLTVNACQWFMCLYWYERRKPFACHMLAAKWFIFLDFYMRQVYHSYVLFGYILKKTKFSLTEFFIFNYFFWYILDKYEYITCPNLTVSCNMDTKPNTISNLNTL